MIVLTVLAWAATAAVLITYAASTVNGEHVRKFDIANAAGFLPLLALNATLGAWQSAIITTGFGVPATIATYRHTVRPRLRRKRKGPVLAHHYGNIVMSGPTLQSDLFPGATIVFDPNVPEGKPIIMPKIKRTYLTVYAPEPLPKFKTHYQPTMLDLAEEANRAATERTRKGCI